MALAPSLEHCLVSKPVPSRPGLKARGTGKRSKERPGQEESSAVSQLYLLLTQGEVTLVSRRQSKLKEPPSQCREQAIARLAITVNGIKRRVNLAFSLLLSREEGEPAATDKRKLETAVKREKARA